METFSIKKKKLLAYSSINRLDATSLQLKYSSSFHFVSLASLDTKVVGPLLTTPAKPLRDELEEFMQRSGNEGVILVSFGTILGNINREMLTLLADAFSRLPQKIIWKLDRGKMFAYRCNIRITER